MSPTAIKDKCAEWRLPRVPPVYCDPTLLPAKHGELGEWIGLTLARHGVPVTSRQQRPQERLAARP